MPANDSAANDEGWLDYLRKGLKSDLLNEKARVRPQASGQSSNTPPKKKPAFEPKDHNDLERPEISLPDELWQMVLQCPCTFPSEVFHGVMLNLVKNPNITSSHLFRADIFYDSEQDHLFQPDDPDAQHGLAKHMKEDLRPRPARWPGFQLERTIVRQLIPRNPQLDKPLVQTCHFFKGESSDINEEHTLVVYIPHVHQAEDMPFYHPAVSQLAFLHSWRQSPQQDSPSPSPHSGNLTLLYRPFPNQPVLTPKLTRTALKLLQTLHKHGQGQLLGYEKRVHHDQLIPQKSYQDTYTRLKTKYGKQLSQQWVEVTDPGKHVFEDIAIAAFLIELWKGMYRLPNDPTDEEGEGEKKPPFPGFVDIGCGNGLLVSILLSENFPGWGFDARHRKTWSILPPDVQAHLQQKILVPRILQNPNFNDDDDQRQAKDETNWHDGDFGPKVEAGVKPGPFVISNHADELTPWTPLLAYLNNSGFIAIPCCSHDLSGARFRAPATSKGAAAAGKSETKPPPPPPPEQQSVMKAPHAAETGSLKRTSPQKKMPSAYSTLCSYVASLATEVGFDPEQEILRIPSTRNMCIVGRRRRESRDEEDASIEQREAHVIDVVERELKRDINSVASDWIAQAQRLMKKPGSGH